MIAPYRVAGVDVGGALEELQDLLQVSTSRRAKKARIVVRLKMEKRKGDVRECFLLSFLHVAKICGDFGGGWTFGTDPRQVLGLTLKSKQTKAKDARILTPASA
jgi:hypothetical protein